MRNIISYCICISVLLSGLGIVGISGENLRNNQDVLLSPDSSPDLSAVLFTAAQSSLSEQTGVYPVMDRYPLDAGKGDYPLGALIWQYQIGGGSDNSPKAIAALDDINADGFDDVVICSEDNTIRCFSGYANGSGEVLWTHEIYSGNIYQQHGLAITEDINGDGYNDCVVGATGGARLIRCISGYNGQTIWTHDTHEYGDGGWVYQVDCGYDYNGDGIRDVVAATGDDSSETGPKRVYCLNGLTGVIFMGATLGWTRVCSHGR